MKPLEFLIREGRLNQCYSGTIVRVNGHEYRLPVPEPRFSEFITDVLTWRNGLAAELEEIDTYEWLEKHQSKIVKYFKPAPCRIEDILEFFIKKEVLARLGCSEKEQLNGEG